MAETQAAPATNGFVWNELGTWDGRAAKSLLTELFGWRAEDMDMGPNGVYTIFKSGDQRVGGAWEMKGERFQGVPTHWLSYVNVQDADATVKAAERLGMTIKVPVTVIPNIGRFAILEHPSISVLAILEPKPM